MNSGASKSAGAAQRTSSSEYTGSGVGVDKLDEDGLWALVRSGNGAAFGSVYDMHRDRIYRQARHLIRSSHDAEDVTALVFLEAWRRRDSVRVVDGSVIAWLLVTTNNVVRNLARTQRRHAAAIAALPRPESSDSHEFDQADERIDMHFQSTEISRALAMLSKREQDIITLCILEDLSTADVALALGIPAGTVKSRLSRAKQRLSSLVSQATVTRPVEGGAL
jgi:RNA polymerase sigma factor (sigma-70 family)